MSRNQPIVALFLGACALSCATVDEAPPRESESRAIALDEADEVTEEIRALIFSDEPVPPPRELVGGTGEPWAPELDERRSVRPPGTIVVVGRLSGDGYTRTIVVHQVSEDAPPGWAPGTSHRVAVPTSCEDEGTREGSAVLVVRDYDQPVAIATLLPGRRGAVAAVPISSNTVRLAGREMALDDLVRMQADEMLNGEGGTE